MGSESQAQTGELHAPCPATRTRSTSRRTAGASPCRTSRTRTTRSTGRPSYDAWRSLQPDYWPARQLSWTTSNPLSLESETRTLFVGDPDERRLDDLWHFRRILYRHQFVAGAYPSDVSVANWPQLDYTQGPLVGVSDEERRRHLEGSKQLSLSFVYWMQTEAPNIWGGQGYPGLQLRGDLTGSLHGLAMYPYVRESRRIQAEFTVLEQHVGVEARAGLVGAERFHDSVGIGSYRIDLHPSTGQRNYVDVANWPFQIPLGALIPVRVDNLLAANKNIGTTHITNGCYRLHPVEWNIGEVAGALAAFCLARRPRTAGRPRGSPRSSRRSRTCSSRAVRRRARVARVGANAAPRLPVRDLRRPATPERRTLIRASNAASRPQEDSVPRLTERLRAPGPTLCVSLLRNDPDLARAVEAEGADAIKLHTNLAHAATGAVVPDLDRESERLSAVLAAVTIPVGIVPRGRPGTTAAEAERLRDMGFEFIDLYGRHTSPASLAVDGIDHWVAPTPDYDRDMLRVLAARPDVDVIEAAFFPVYAFGYAALRRRPGPPPARHRGDRAQRHAG
jgi:hypothetical protein